MRLIYFCSAMICFAATTAHAQVRNPGYERAFSAGLVDENGKASPQYYESVWQGILGRNVLTPNDLKKLQEKPSHREVLMDKYDPQYRCASFGPRKINFKGKEYNHFTITDSAELGCLDRSSFPSAPWPVRSASWTNAEELEFQQFVRRIGDSQCTNVDLCLTDPAINPYVNETDLLGSHYSDCADFPIFLRCYFAWKKGLTCAQPANYRGNPLRANQQRLLDSALKSINDSLDLTVEQKEQQKTSAINRFTSGNYTQNGSYPISLPAILPLQSGSLRSLNSANRNFFSIMRNVVDTVSSGNFRMLKTLPSQPLPVFYSPKISKDAITPGTIAYDATGHVGVVFNVLGNGNIRLIDAHPDNSVSRKTYASSWRDSLFSHGDGLKKLRPYSVANLSQTANGLEWTANSRTKLVKDEDIADFSLVQYLGHIQNRPIAWNGVQFCQVENQACLREANGDIVGNAENKVDGERRDWKVISNGTQLNLNLENFMSMILSGSKVKPIVDFEVKVNALCSALQGRYRFAQSIALEKSDNNSIDQLPSNVFAGSDAPPGWFNDSTPMSDSRIRDSVRDLVAFAQRAHNSQKSRDPAYDFEGQSFKQRAIEIYGRVANSCVLPYMNSQRENLPASFSGAIERVVRMSFIPQLCAEMRMGAMSPIELATCKADPTEEEMYNATRLLYGTMSIDQGVFFGYTVNQLTARARGLSEPSLTPFQLDRALNELN